MSKIILNNVSSLLDATTAAITINTNSATIQNAMDNTLSRDGTDPNQMNAPIDMNSNHIFNLPAPVSANDPVRFQDLNTLQAGGTVTTLPVGGTTGQVLTKHSNTNFDVQWGNSVTSVGLSLPADFTVTNSPVTTTGTLTGVYVNTPTGTGGFVRQTSPTITTPVISSITNTGTLTLPTTTDTLVGRATTDTLTHKTFDTAGAGNSFLINGLAATANTGTGSVVRATSPTLVTPTLGAATATTLAFSPTTGGIIGTATNDNTNAGNVGELITATSTATGITTATQTNITSISLTAGDWDVVGSCIYTPAATTVIADVYLSISTTSAVLNNNVGNTAKNSYGAVGAGITPGVNNFLCLWVGPSRISIAGTTTVFLVGFADFTTSTLQTTGLIRARRVR